MEKGEREREKKSEGEEGRKGCRKQNEDRWTDGNGKETRKRRTLWEGEAKATRLE